MNTTQLNSKIRRFFSRIGGGGVKALQTKKEDFFSGNGGDNPQPSPQLSSNELVMQAKYLIEGTFGFYFDENDDEQWVESDFQIGPGDNVTTLGNPDTADYGIWTGNDDDGWCYIYVTEDELKTIKDITDVGRCQVMWIDLGLPSGTLWADRNIGARSEEDFGYYFMAGIINPFRGQGSDAEYSSTISNYLEVDGILPENMKYLGIIGSPSLAACQELIANTTQTPESINGVDGMRFTSNKNQNSIFIPLSGYWNASGDTYHSEETHLMVSKGGTYQTVMSSYLDGGTPIPFSVNQNSDYWQNGLCIRPCIEGNFLV